jgi:hypothetical protein
MRLLIMGDEIISRHHARPRVLRLLLYHGVLDG